MGGWFGSRKARPSREAVDRALSELSGAEADPGRHLALGRAWLESGEPRFAYACARAARALGGDRAAADGLLDEAGRAAGWDEPRSVTPRIEHNRHYRMRTLSERLIATHGETLSVLDVGGGDGELGLFLPRADYVVAEPYVNGLSGLSLPFEPRQFDAVTSCHVLEHVPKNEREAFLDRLLACADKTLLLLGPFHVPRAKQTAALEWLVEITDAPWAHEHLECGLPELDEVRDWAASRQLGCEVTANGSHPLATALVVARHYAAMADRLDELEPLQELLNDAPVDDLTHVARPAAYLVQITRP